jgi:crotonobetainyl-CoA:carnitine CoA-transferase CaiB-like acyl-CoA transferase
LLEHHFVERLADDWVGLLSELGVPATAVREESWMNRDAFLDPEMLDSGRVCAFDHPVHGGIRIIGDLIRLSHQSSARRGRAPLLGEHTRQVLSSLGYDDDRIESLVASAAVAALGEITQTP